MATVEIERPDVGIVRIVLDPSGAREYLAKFGLRDRTRRASTIKEDRARTRCTLIQCQNEGHARGVTSGPAGQTGAAPGREYCGSRMPCLQPES